MNFSALRKTLKTGAIVFGLSAVFLLVLPAFFLDLLGLSHNSEMIWSMRMIGITLIALSGNMWNNSSQSSDTRVGNVAKVMCVSATALGVLTLLNPTELTWFSYVYTAIGFGFGLSYLINLIRK
jgi:hypothetical protein